MGMIDHIRQFQNALPFRTMFPQRGGFSSIHSLYPEFCNSIASLKEATTA
jgi:hypothetical protein